MELQCNSFKITMWQLQTTKICFIDIFRQNIFSYKQALGNSFYLTSLLVFQLYQGKQIVFKQTLDMTTQNMLLQLIYHAHFFKAFYSSEEIKDVFLLGKSKSLDDESLTKLWCESEKDSCGMVLASPSVSLTCRIASDFTICLKKYNCLNVNISRFCCQTTYFFENENSNRNNDRSNSNKNDDRSRTKYNMKLKLIVHHTKQFENYWIQMGKYSI